MSLQVLPFKSLPMGIKHGVGGLIGRRLYVGLGSAGKRLFFCDLEQADTSWEEATPFPGSERNDAVAITTETRLYVFSGAGIENGNTHPTVLTDGYYFDALSHTWNRVENSAPVGLLGACGCELEPGKLVFFGGYNKQTFDEFLAQISAVDVSSQPETHQQLLSAFMSQPEKNYRWNRDIWQFDTQSQAWTILAVNPFPANCGAGLVQQDSTVTVIEGEVKPGLRSLETKQFTFDADGEVRCHALPSIADNHPDHEGIAGGFAGQINHHLIIAGGAYFVGSQDNYRKRQWYCHQGLDKHYSTDIWRCDGKQWRKAGQLSTGIGYGVSISVNNQVYLLGGEDKAGTAQSSCYTLSGSQ